MFSKKKNELKNANKLQINQVFNRGIKSYLKKDSVSASFISCITLLNPPFSSRIQNNSCSHFFFFFTFSFFPLKIKPLVAKIKCLPLQSQTWYQRNFKVWDLIHYNVNLMTDVFKFIVKYRRKIITKYRHLSPSGSQA